jgi:hypothetical protein
MFAAVRDTLVLDASDVGFIRSQRPGAVGRVNFPSQGDNHTPIFEGDWFSVTAGTPFKVDIMIGDEGGQFNVGLFVQKKGESYSFGNYGLPQLPLATFGSLSPPEKNMYRKYLGDVAFSGPVFKGSGGSMLGW